MKIQYASDLHLEFIQNRNWIAQNPIISGGDILILNGDIIILRKGFEKDSFFDFVSENFKQTYIIPGNHEFYGGYDMRNVLELNIDLRHNVKLLNNQTINFGSTKIIFTTLWTHISNSLIEDYLNDFHKSYYKNTKLNTKNYNLLHQECVAFLEKELANNEAEKTIVVSHHIPTEKANGFVGGDPLLGQAFVVNLESLLEKYSIDYWIYGHSHRNKNCEDFGIKFKSNQMGYVHCDEHKDFNREALIEI